MGYLLKVNPSMLGALNRASTYMHSILSKEDLTGDSKYLWKKYMHLVPIFEFNLGNFSLVSLEFDSEEDAIMFLLRWQ